jgi:hypothetical protein
MSANNKSSFLTKISQFDVKDHAARDFLVTTRGCLPCRQDPEGNPDVLNFLRPLGSEGIAIKVVKLICLLNGLGGVNAILVGPFEITRLMFANKRYDLLSLSEDVVNPLIEGGLMVNASGLSKFGGLNRIGLLQVFEVYPRSGAIFPLAA